VGLKATHGLLHFPHGPIEANQGGAADDAMADIQFFHTWELCDWVNVPIGQPVARIHPEAKFDRQFAAFVQGSEFGGLFMGFAGFGVASGVEFDKLCAGVLGGFDLVGFGVDEQADGNARVLKLADDFGHAAGLSGDVESAFGGDFFAFFGDEGDVVGLDAEGDRDHFVGGGHFQIQVVTDGLAQDLDVAVLDVATVFAQVDGDAIGSREFNDRGGGDGVGFDGAAGLADRGDMVDVDAEGKQGSTLLDANLVNLDFTGIRSGCGALLAFGTDFDCPIEWLMPQCWSVDTIENTRDESTIRW
jgi:hypothetical protein